MEADMKIKGDYHMHTKYSGDCKNELEDIVQKAIALGLEEIAITDHGPAHSGYGIKREDFFKLREEIDLINEKYPNIRVLMGLEANLLDETGLIDVDEEMRSKIDWLNAGYHFGSRFAKDWRIHLLNYMSRFSKKAYEKAKAINTKTMVEAMKKNKINMITHPGAKGPIDIEAVAKVAADTGTFLEINASHGHLTVESIQIAMQYDVTFVVNSDAHKIERIGGVDKGFERIKASGLSTDRVYNLK